MKNILKWLPAIVGAALFLVGLVLKILENPASYDQFISGNSYILIIIGIVAVILNYAFNHIMNESDNNQ